MKKERRKERKKERKEGRKEERKKHILSSMESLYISSRTTKTKKETIS